MFIHSHKQYIVRSMNLIDPYKFSRPIFPGVIFEINASDINCYAGSGNLVSNLAGNYNNGNINGTVSFDPIYKSFDFSTPGNYIDFGASSSLIRPSQATFTCLIKTPASFNSRSDVFSMWAPGYACYMLFLLSGNQMIFYMNLNGNSLQNTNVGILAANTWYYITVTHDGFVTKTFINAVMQNQSTRIGSIQNNGDSIKLYAGDSVGREGDFNGKIAKLKIYNRAISNSEILEEYNSDSDGYI